MVQDPQIVVRCAIYSRVSTDKNVRQELTSIDAQKETCSAYIRSQAFRGWAESSERYEDVGQSGSGVNRPALNKLIRHIEGRKVDAIVVYKIDRLTRSLRDFVQLMDLLSKHHIAFVCVTQAFDTSDSIGRLIMNVLMTFAQFERELIVDRVKMKMDLLRQRGRWLGGPPPFGYDVVSGKLIINLQEAKIVRDLFDRYPTSPSLKKLLRDLQAEGVPAKAWVTQAGVRKGGGLIGLNGLRLILTNPVYIGCFRGVDGLVQGEHLPIVDKDDWERVAQIRKARAPVMSWRTLSILPPGLLHDAVGRRMYPCQGRAADRRHDCYTSERSRWAQRSGVKRFSVRAHELERLLLTSLQCFLRDPESLLQALPHNNRRSAARTISAGESAASRLEDLEVPETRALLGRLIRRVEIGRDQMCISIIVEELETLVGAPNDRLEGKRTSSSSVHLLKISCALISSEQGSSCPVLPRASRRGRPDPQLLRLLRESESAEAAVLQNRDASLSEIARLLGHRSVSRLTKLVRLNYLAPDIKASITDGSHPAALSRHKLLRSSMPLDWVHQRAILGFPAIPGQPLEPGSASWPAKVSASESTFSGAPSQRQSKPLSAGNIVDAVRLEGVSMRQARALVRDLIIHLREALVSGEGVKIEGFGSFLMRERAPRTIPDLLRGGSMKLGPRRSVKFVPAGQVGLG